MPEGALYIDQNAKFLTPAAALVQLGQQLRESGYRFITVTPESHRRVNARKGSEQGRSLRDVFGWNRPFLPESIPDDIYAMMLHGKFVEPWGAFLRSTVRFSNLGDGLYAHSSFPTDKSDAVFFGPDTHRFARLIESELATQPLSGTRLLDIGCGSGAGGLFAAGIIPDVPLDRLVLTDINPSALWFTHVNALLAGMSKAECIQSDVLSSVAGFFDLILSNPPYMADAAARAYRNGGGALGADLSHRILEESLPRLAPGGRLVLYTGVAIVAGLDAFHERIRKTVGAAGMTLRYSEIDPDVFGEELDGPGYRTVDRIAAVAAIVDAPSRKDSL